MPLNPVSTFILGTVLIVTGLVGFVFMPWGLALLFLLLGVVAWVAVFKNASNKSRESKRTEDTASSLISSVGTCCQCRKDILQSAAYCQYCGASQDVKPKGFNSDMEPEINLNKVTGFIRRHRVLCLVVSVFAIFFIIVLSGGSDTENERVTKASINSKTLSATTAPDSGIRLPHTAIPVQGITGKPRGEDEDFIESSPSPEIATHTPVPAPTILPTPDPLQVELEELLKEYDQNKVLANKRLRYQENGKVPITTSGYVANVEELYVTLTPSKGSNRYDRLNCYYADTRTALHLTKGQSVSVTGRVVGLDNFKNAIMASCDFEEIAFEKKPTILSQELRQNAVQVICVTDSANSLGYKGSGVIIDAKEGIVLTVHHVVADEKECGMIVVGLPGVENQIQALVIKHCASIDRARLRISPEALSSLPLQPIYRTTAPAQTDQEIYFWGYGPNELRMSTGTVINVVGKDIVTDAYAVPGDSGSPVFDEYGHFLGTMSRSNRSDRAIFTGDEC